MQETVENLWEEDFYVIGEDVPDEPGKEFVTPTIVPLRADALGNIDKPTVVIQYKTYPMSEGANPNEADNLATGNRIHHLGPLTGAGIVVWTCSDLLNDEDDDLQEQVRKYVKRGTSSFTHSVTRNRSTRSGPIFGQVYSLTKRRDVHLC